MVLARILEPLSRKLSVDFRYTAIFSFRPRAVVSGCGDFVHSIVYVFFFLFFFFITRVLIKIGWVFRAFREMVKMAELVVVELDDIFRVDCTCMDSG